MNVNDKRVKDLRAQFLKKLEESDSDLFHTFDINRVKTDDKYLNRFILHNDGNQENAFTMLWETCEWRKKFGVNGNFEEQYYITEKNVNQIILESGSVYSHGKDKDGKTLLIFKSKKHIKGAHDFEDQKRCLVYWMERLERQDNGEMISLFFDMDGAVLANMDMEYTKYLISLFKNYYPHFLNYIIIFEMAWMLNAVFRIIKTWLPPKAVEKMKFVNKSNVKDYVDPEYCLKPWGGKDTYVYRFEPEVRNQSTLVNGDDIRKKVHFAESSFKKDQLHDSGFEESTPPISPTSLTITPPDVMIFTQEGNETTSTILLTNDESQSISYKIKTTSPEKFRVRPTVGVLSPGSNATISVVLLPGYHLQSLKWDKFLIMSIPIERSDVSLSEINEVWKQMSDKDIKQHRLRCAGPQPVSNDYSAKNGSAFSPQSTDDQKVIARLCSDITKLNTYVGTLREEIKLIRRQQWIIILALIVLLCSLYFIVYVDDKTSQTLTRNCWADNQRG